MGNITSRDLYGVRSSFGTQALPPEPKPAKKPVQEPQALKVEENLQPPPKGIDLEHCFICGRAPTHTAKNNEDKPVAFCGRCVPLEGLSFLHDVQELPQKAKPKAKSRFGNIRMAPRQTFRKGRDDNN